MGSWGSTVACGALYGMAEVACGGPQARGRCRSIEYLPGNDATDPNFSVDHIGCLDMGYGRNATLVKPNRAGITVAVDPGTVRNLGQALGFGLLAVDFNTWFISHNWQSEEVAIPATLSLGVAYKPLETATQHTKVMGK